MPALTFFDAGLHTLQARELLPDTNQASVFAVGIVFSIIAIVVMALRIHCRVNIINVGLASDDYLMLVGVLCNIGLSAANMVCAWYGAGVHVEDVPLENYPYLLKSNYANRLLYVFALCFVKLSILVFYLRIDHRRWTRMTIHFLMFTVIGLTISTACICIFECYPPSLFWDMSGLNRDKCMDTKRRQTFFEANGIINIVQDLGIWLIPIPMLWKLQVPRRQRVAVIFLFCIGIVALVAGCIRYYYVLKLKNEEDIWFYFADSLNWCSIEVYAAIICGSASTFRILFRTYMPGLWGSRATNSGMKGHPYNPSNTGDFALKPYGAGSQLRSGNKDLTVNDTSGVDSQSERLESERSTLAGDAKRGIMMSKEFAMKISDPRGDEGRAHVTPFNGV